MHGFFKGHLGVRNGKGGKSFKSGDFSPHFWWLYGYYWHIVTSVFRHLHKNIVSWMICILHMWLKGVSPFDWKYYPWLCTCVVAKNCETYSCEESGLWSYDGGNYRKQPSQSMHWFHKLSQLKCLDLIISLYFYGVQVMQQSFIMQFWSSWSCIFTRLKHYS